MKKIIITFLFATVLIIIAINNAAAQNVDVVNTAISEGDCETLYRIINDPQGIDQRLLTTANQALRRYTVNDTVAARYRTNRMDSRVRSVAAALMEKVSAGCCNKADNRSQRSAAESEKHKRLDMRQYLL